MCPNCQAPIRGDEDFCTSCGTPLNRTATAADQPPFAQAAPTQLPVTQQPVIQQPPAPQPYGQPVTQQPPAPPFYAKQSPPAQPYGQQPPTQQQPPAPYQPAAPGQPPSGQQVPSWQGQPRQSSVQPFSFDLKRLGTADRIIGGTSGVVFISLFLPWFGFLGATISGISAHGYLLISLLTSLALIAYLVLRAGWDTLPVKLPIAHAPLLLIATGVQLLFVLIAFLFKPAYLSWEIGAYLSLLAALAGCGVIAVPAIRSLQGTAR